MRSTKEQAARIQASIDRLDASRIQLARLEREYREAGEAVRNGMEILVLDLARERGLLDLLPNAVIAAFEKFKPPYTAIEASDAALTGMTSLPEQELIPVVVRFGNHDGEKRNLLLAAELVRNGRFGAWQGSVTAAMASRLERVFGKKFTLLVAAQSTQSTNSCTDETAGNDEIIADNVNSREPTLHGETDEKISGQRPDPGGLKEFCNDGGSELVPSDMVSLRQTNGFSNPRPHFFPRRPPPHEPS